ncbi:PIN domain-containing protein, partial [Candidatus Gottesmanbacteria bacterium]|nr:PIN domain-containing protein [Candidatus Gottesmanbacteria bacterium]
KDDPEDNKFLECAVGGKARFIVSGDNHLLAIKEYGQILIVTPATFLSKTQ